MHLFHRSRPVRTVGLVLAGLLLLVAARAGAQTSNRFWQSQSIYQLITDRFYNGDTNNDNAEGTYAPSNPTGVHGGDFAGITQKLDYIKALGATAIWISPIVLNTEGQFHGYSAWNFYEVAPHWGSISNLQAMVQAAHARGLLVIDDIVVNHAGDLVTGSGSGYPTYSYPAGYPLSYANSSKTYPAPFNLSTTNPSLTNLFHNYGNIGNYSDTNQVLLGWLSGLNDFRTETPYVRSNMAAIYQYWIAQIGFDAFRVDTALEVDMGCWQSFCPAIHTFAATNGNPNFFMFAEADNGSDSVVAPYTGQAAGGAFEFDSAVDYPLYYAINNVFATASGNTSQIDAHYANLDSLYDPAARMQMVTFLDNHDNPRFLSTSESNNNTNRLAAALAFLYSSRGVPCLYYGTEQGFDGTTDPNDREDMFAGEFKDGASGSVQQLSSPGADNFNMTSPIFLWIAQLNNFRRLYPAMSLGSYVSQYNNTSSAGLYAYSRILTNQEVFVVFNTASSSQTLPGRTLTYPGGTVLVNLLNPNETYTLTSGSQTPSITVPAMTAKIFIAQSQVLPLNPVVTLSSPAHWATNIQNLAPVVLQFSKSMNTNSVQNAFSTLPAVSGLFSWASANATNDTMTFVPNSTGWPGSTLITVRLTNSAVDAVSGNVLYSPFQMQFKTAAVSDYIPPVVTLLTPTNGATISGSLQISGTASDNAAVQQVQVQLDSGVWTTVAGTTSWSLSLNSSNFLNGPHVINARATDMAGNISTNASVNVKFFNVPGNYVQRISGGNPTNVTDCSGNVWLADTNYVFGAFGYSPGGGAGYLNNTITGICANAQSLYQREHYSTNSGGYYYEFDCPEGVYQIILLEAETYWSGTGKREFNVFIQGAQVLTNFDIYAKAGGMNIPITLLFTNNVTNSQLQILFTPVIDNARVSGVQASKIADVFSDTDGIPDWWRLAYFGHALGQAGDKSRGPDDADGDGISNLTEYLNGTNPQNAASFPTLPPFHITPIFITASYLQISCPTVSNWSYVLQSASVLNAGSNWNNSGITLRGTGGAILFTNGVSTTNSAMFYRVHAF